MACNARMGFTVLIPARLASSRLPDKPLADIHGAPMVVRVAQRASKSRALHTVVASDSPQVIAQCTRFGIRSVLTRANHPSGSDRLAEACDLLGLADDAIAVNVQGDEPMIDPELIDAVAGLLDTRPDCAMSTAACPIDEMTDFLSPHVVKVVLDARQTALYFSRAPIPAVRDVAVSASGDAAGMRRPLRHIGIYGYRVGFLRRFPQLMQAPIEQLESLEQLRALWHGYKIAVHISSHSPGPGVDTREDLERVRRLTADGDYFTAAV